MRPKLHLSVGQRIALGYVVMALLVFLAASLGFRYIQLTSQTVDVTEQGFAQAEQIGELERNWANVAATIDNMLLTRQLGLVEFRLAVERSYFNQQMGDVQRVALATRPETMSENEIILQRLSALAGDLNGVVRQISDHARFGRWARAQALRHTEMAALQRRFDENLTVLLANIREDVRTSVAASTQAQSVARSFWVSSAIAAVLGAVILGTLATRSVSRPVNELIDRVQRIARQDFSQQDPLDREDEIGELSRALSLMTDWLRQSYGELEQRVAERTVNLRATADIGRQLSTILDETTLVNEVVDQISKSFGYYHVQVYLWDEGEALLQMVSGTGAPGRALLARAHAIPRGKGLVGKAAATNQPTVVGDVSQDPNWLPNPLLPNTKAEIALPLAIGEQVFGVLDVQDHKPLGQDDVDLLEPLANQTAVALRNARSYAEVQQQAEQAARAGEINQKIQRATTVEDVLRVAARELGQTLGVKGTRVQLTRSAAISDTNGNGGGSSE